MTGLGKQTLEIPLVAGLTQQIAPEVAPVGALYDLTNVEIDRVGNHARRHGHELMSRSAFNVGTSSVSITMGAPKKIGGRQEELWVITAQSYYLGSGGGGGASGDMLWTYSPELDAWKPHTRVPRPTVERWAGLASSGIEPEHASVAFVSSGSRSLLVLAYAVKRGFDTDAAVNGVHVVVYDVTSRAALIEDTVLEATSINKVRVASIGSKAMVVWTRTVGGAQMKFSVFDAADPNDGFTAPAFLLGDPQDGDFWNIATDGTNLFVHWSEFASANRWLERFDTAGATSGAILIDAIGGGSGADPALYVAGGRVHMAWNSREAVSYASITTAGAGFTGIFDVTVLPAPDIPQYIGIAALDADRATVFYANNPIPSSAGTTVGTAAYKMHWRQVSSGSTVPVIAATEHTFINVVSQNDAFVFDGRVFLPVTGADLENQFRLANDAFPFTEYTGYGHVLVEIAPDGGSGVAYMSPLPVSVWSRDASRSNANFFIPNGAFGENSDRYLASLRLLRNVDRFGGGGRDPGGGSTTEPALDTTSAYGIDIMRLSFDDKKRWAHSEINSCATIACGVPYSYDGLLAHESGFIFRPEVLGLREDGTGNFIAGNLPTYKVTCEWEDMHGKRWFSDSSYPAQLEIVGTNVSLDIRVRLLTLSAKPLGGSYSFGKIKTTLFRSMADAPEDFQKIAEKYINLYDTQNITFADDGADLYRESERIYTIGGELDNALAPPCRSLVQHGARLACISTDDGKLWLTKETRYQRGIEWSAYLTMTLPQRGMALASSEQALIVLCEKSIYAMEGSGPDALGQPADGFGKLSLLSHDKGCSEINAAWRVPGGVLYRGYQGLWMIGGGLGISFIGEAVTDFTDDVERFVDSALDTRHGRLQLLCLMTDGDYRVLNFWYDSNRWSVDTVEEEEGAQYSTTVHQGIYYRALERGVYKYSDVKFSDANASPLYLASVRTGWLRMGNMHDFKRVWRGLGTVGKIRAEEAYPILDLRMTVENENGICASRLFTSNLFPPLGDWSVRMHLAKQKGKAFRVQLTEVPNIESDEQDEGGIYVRESPGYTYSCLGLEFGVKRGAAKLPATRTK